MSPRLKGAAFLTLAFVFGVVVGVVGFGAVQARWGWQWSRGHPERLLRQLDRAVGLTPAQRRQVEAILRDTRQEFAQLREEVGPRFREIRARSRARIREVLEPAQREKFDAFSAREDARVRRRFGGGPAPPGGR